MEGGIGGRSKDPQNKKAQDRVCSERVGNLSTWLMCTAGLRTVPLALMIRTRRLWRLGEECELYSEGKGISLADVKGGDVFRIVL